MSQSDGQKQIDLEAIIAPHDIDGKLAESCRKLAGYLDGGYGALAEDYWSFWINSAEFGPGFDAERIRRYLEAEQPFDCAGSFKAEGLGVSLFRATEGSDATSLIGLPLIRLVDMLTNESVQIP